MKNTKNGITLIALVLTIIVLLILAGVSIAMLSVENGILKQATNTKEKMTKAEEEEKIKMSVMGSSINDEGLVEILNEESFKSELKNQFGNQELDVVVNGDGSFIVTVKETKRKYYVNDDKTVINSDNIIEINNEEKLKTFRDEVNSGNSYEGKVVLLTNDIDLQGEEWEPIGYYDQVTEDIRYPDTEDNKPFRGIFDGGNCKINGINIVSDEICNGFFGLVIDGTIRNVTIGKNNVIQGDKRTAGVVGYLYGFNGNISNCINYSDIIGGHTTGGIAGSIVGQHTIYNCKNYGDIIGLGGIVGGSNGTDYPKEFDSYFHKIINCGNYGTVKQDETYNAGGIVGYFKGSIFNCCNKGSVSGGGTTGGIAGGIDGKVENCYNIGDIQGYRTGGILNPATTIGGSAINCYSIGTIIATTSNKGDIMGTGTSLARNEIINCYTKNDTFTEKDLGDTFKKDSEEINNGYPILYWE